MQKIISLAVGGGGLDGKGRETIPMVVRQHIFETLTKG